MIEMETTADTTSDRWWTRPYSNVQTNIQEIDATMDVEQALDFIEAQGADTWLLNVGGIASFYPTDLPFQTRVPFLGDRPSGDLIGDAVAAASKRNVRVLARLDFSKVSTRIAHEHPDWLFRSPSGKPQIYNTLYTTCPCGDYYQHRSFDIIDEILDRYAISGFFVNWFRFSEFDYSRNYHGVCHCEKCKTAFGAFAGDAEIPDTPQHPNYSLWLRFATGVLQGIVDRLAKHLEEKKPGVALIMSRRSPIIYYEANNGVGREPWHHATSEAVSVYRTGMPTSSILVNSTSFVDMPYRMAGEQPEHFAQYLLQAVARGGNPSTYLMGAPGRIPYTNLPIAGEIQRFYRENRAIYSDYRPSSTVALVRPDPLGKAEEGYVDSVTEFRGLYAMLKEKHIPFDVLAAELIAQMAGDGSLARYSTIILPDLGEVGLAAECLDDYVAQGGSLVLTGTSTVTPEGGIELASAPAAMRAATPRSGIELWATYISDNTQPNAGAFRYSGAIVPVFGKHTSFVWKPSSKKSGYLLPQAPYGPPEKCYGHISSGEPAAVRMSSGEGVVVQIPWTVGRTYHEFGTTAIRDYFLSTIDDLFKARVSAHLPEQVEVIVGRVDGGEVIHVINQTGARRRTFGPHVPIAGGNLRVRGGFGSPKLLVSQRPPETKREGDDLVIELPPVELFEVIFVPTSP